MKYLFVAIVVAVVGLETVHVYSLEGLGGWFQACLAEKEDTVYAPGFSEAAFRRVRVGMTETEVLGELTSPLSEVWFYAGGSTGTMIGFTGNRVDHLSGAANRVAVGATRESVRTVLGEPQEKSLVYSRSKADNSYHVRTVILRNGKVSQRVAEFYVD
jgi:hypothetical protein